MTIKDSLETAGVISTAGAVGRRSFVPRQDATIVARLRAAGAILLAKSNTPMFTYGGETNNEVYGRTNNPYDISKSPAGSSGGAGAIVAAGGSAFDIGSDTGGSIRLPAYFCGIAGIKPTHGRVPLTGHILSYTEGIRASIYALGPLARRVEDLETILSVIQGVDWRDPFVVPMPLPSLRTVDIRKLRVSFHRDNGIVTPSQEVQDAVQKAAATLAEAGARVEEVRPPGIEEYSELMRDPRRSDGGASRARLLRLTGTPEPAPGTSTAPVITSSQVDDFLSQENAFRSRMLSFMESYDVIICPVYHQIPQAHGWTKQPNYSYTFVFNTLGWPAAAVRTGTSSNGLPMGVQIAARPWRDEVALAVAAVLESKLGGWQPPSI
jgi:amidase